MQGAEICSSHVISITNNLRGTWAFLAAFGPILLGWAGLWLGHTASGRAAPQASPWELLLLAPDTWLYPLTTLPNSSWVFFPSQVLALH